MPSRTLSRKLGKNLIGKNLALKPRKLVIFVENHWRRHRDIFRKKSLEILESFWARAEDGSISKNRAAHLNSVGRKGGKDFGEIRQHGPKSAGQEATTTKLGRGDTPCQSSGNNFGG